MSTISDAAISFSLAYLEVLESTLEISWTAAGDPICVPEYILDTQLIRLKTELEELLRSSSSIEARAAAAAFGAENIQTVPFGHVSDFDVTVKIGFLYGDRVVLWDIIASRLLAQIQLSARGKNVISQTVCNLLLLKPVVARGGVVILPHPIFWSELARQINAEARHVDNRSTAQLGLSFALAAVDAGLPLHPYTLLSDEEAPVATSHEYGIDANLYSTENALFHRAAAALITDVRMAYLRDISAARFYEIVSEHSPMQYELRKHFSRSLAGVSRQQHRMLTDSLIDDLVEQVSARNQAIQAYVSGGIAASLGVVSSALTGLDSVAGVTTMTLIGVAPGVLSAIREWWNQPEKHVVVQAFKSLSRAQDREAETLHLSENRLISRKARLAARPEIAVHVDALLAGSWTEDKHRYLMDLDASTAREVLQALEPEQLELIVNYRRFQEDYIGDYLEDVWNLDEDSFWEHMNQTFESDEGIVQYDGFRLNEIMCSFDMPLRTWILLLSSIPRVYAPLILDRALSSCPSASNADYSVTDFQLETVMGVVRFQLEEAETSREKQEALCIWLSALQDSDRQIVMKMLLELYDALLPDWLTTNMSSAPD
jgi:hypothetical protein